MSTQGTQSSPAAEVISGHEQVKVKAATKRRLERICSLRRWSLVTGADEAVEALARREGVIDQAQEPAT